MNSKDFDFKLDTTALNSIQDSIDSMSIFNNSALQRQVEATNRAIEEASNQRYQEKQDAIAREERQIELLEDIKQNTSYIPEMVKLLTENNEYQKDILEFMNELNAIATLQDKTKATNKYRDVMNKIKLAISDVNTMTTIWGYGVAFGEMLKGLGVIN